MVYSLTYPLLYFTPVTIIELPSTLTQLYSLVVLLHLITKLSRMQKKMPGEEHPLVHTPIGETNHSLSHTHVHLLLFISQQLSSSSCH